jgi:hypothetical protein
MDGISKFIHKTYLNNHPLPDNKKSYDRIVKWLCEGSIADNEIKHFFLPPYNADWLPHFGKIINTISLKHPERAL